MNSKIIINENNYLNKFFKTNKSYEKDIKQNIFTKLEDIIVLKPYKIKTVNHLKRNNNVIYEYKIVVKNNKFRVAYTKHEDIIEVFFISTKIIKNEFVKLLENTKLID